MAYTQKTYTESDAVKKWREQMEAQTGLKPADYVSKYQDQLNSTMDSILSVLWRSDHISRFAATRRLRWMYWWRL